MNQVMHGLILREAVYKDSSKILTVLTDQAGKITVSARGAKRKGSRIAAVSSLYAYSEMTLAQVRGRWYLHEGNTIELFTGLRRDLGALSLAAYVCELLEATSDTDTPGPELLRLGLNTLYCLSRGEPPIALVKPAFELKLMCLCGYEPLLLGCAVCGDAEGPFYFDCSGGVTRCTSCRSGTEIPLRDAVLAAMRYIVSADIGRVFSFQLMGEARKQLSQLCERYVETQLERRFQTLIYYKQLELDHDTI